MNPSSVNTAVTPDRRQPHRPAPRTSRRRRVVENDDYAAFTRRVLSAHARRVATGDIDGLAALAALAADIDSALRTAVTGLRQHGYSWAEIAARLGTTRQAAHQRFTSPPDTAAASGADR